MESKLRIPIDNLNYLRCKKVMHSKKSFELLKKEIMDMNETDLIDFDKKYHSLVYEEYNKLFDKLSKLDKKLSKSKVSDEDYDNYEKQKQLCFDFIEMEGKFYECM